MKNWKQFVKKEIVLLVAAVLAVASAFFVPPDAGYAQYINYSVLAILFCLMAAVGGMRRAGLFDRIASAMRILADAV